ncbi:glucose 1-dehydrogenase [Intrasporangium sp. YIM S08009]|uniref:glucose 1-dehydrogenase n=1 Tax=Intrasporangium zincisolvens TaxID=3080018 RepID=UPI002B05B11A|nr:glucose 1-dehydrogenase [Intrasporangium sp. YIM S08009]
MQAVTVIPGVAGSAALEDVPDPAADVGPVLVEALAVGVCGTDAEIANGAYGWAPPGEERLILGHESLGRVLDPGPTRLAVGEHVVGIVRRPDPMPCPSCAVGEWDMCSNGLYTERGIKQAHGFMAERWRSEPEYLVRVDRRLGTLGVLLEPTTVVTKAWQHILSIGQRTFWDPQVVLVVGAGPIGLLAALIGVQLGREVHVLDRVTTGPKPGLVEQLGAVYHVGSVADLGLQPDIVIECTGVVPLIVQAADAVAPGGIVCLTGIGSPSDPTAETAALLAKDAVLKNLVVFGSVNANRRHYYRAARVLARADQAWLEQLVTRRVQPADVDRALAGEPDDIKVVMEFAQP